MTCSHCGAKLADAPGTPPFERICRECSRVLLESKRRG